MPGNMGDVVHGMIGSGSPESSGCDRGGGGGGSDAERPSLPAPDASIIVKKLISKIVKNL